MAIQNTSALVLREVTPKDKRTVYSLLSWYRVPRSDVDDLAQNSLFVLASYRTNGEDGEDSIPTASRNAFLRSVVKHQILKYRRQQGRRRELFWWYENLYPAPVAKSPHEEVSELAPLAMLNCALASLRSQNPGQYDVLILVADGVPFTEIATALRIPKNTVKSRFGRGCEALREQARRWAAKEAHRVACKHPEQ